MQKRPVILEELVNALETNGEISITNGMEDLFIQSVDDKEGYDFVSSTNEEFYDSKDAVNWAVERMNGLDSIEEWE